ncbi:uncharacterized protein [Palaemon carinicauda]|uniref:uncharacterized protein n=1 Tax=Palaemon carinicauda TaxID=392227 RepID=UPI0035B5E182
MKTSAGAKPVLSSLTVLALLSCACAAEVEAGNDGNSTQLRLDVPATGAGKRANAVQVMRNYIGSTFAILGLIFILRELSHGFLLLLGPSKEEEQESEDADENTDDSGMTTAMPPEMYDSYSYYDRYDYYYPPPPPRHPGYRSLRNNDPLISHILNSIDIVESTFSMLDIDEPACRKRAVCEIQRTASAFPLLGEYLRYLSQSVLSLDNYREAQDAGSALEDCALLFTECPDSVLSRKDIPKD